jgi:nucleoside 2-deoxyribosyltransferase
MKRQEDLVYLAGPYSHRLNRIRHRRYNQLTEVSARLLQQGILNFSPITHSHNQQEFLEDFSTGFDDWRRNDLAYVSRCEEVMVLMIPGWDKSYGVKEEIKFAKKNGIPVTYIHVLADDLVVSESPTSYENPSLVINGERSTL